MSAQKLLQPYAFFVYSNLWIACCAASCGWQLPWLGMDAPSPALLAVLFFGTSFRYNLIGFTVSATASSEKFAFAWRYRHWLQALCIASGLGACAALYWLSPLQIVALAHLGLLSLWYIFPLPGRLAPPLRKLPYVKIFLIAYVWAWSIWWLPYLQNHNDWPTTAQWLGFAERACFVFAITLPFDIRDMEADALTHVWTIPRRLGMSAAKWLGGICLLTCGILAYWAYPAGALLPLCLSYTAALALLTWATPHRHDLYFLGAVDGTMLLQTLLLWSVAQ